MTKDSLETDIQNATKSLLAIAKGSTWNDISDNCKYIISEIRDSEKNFIAQNKISKKENDLKIPVTLHEILPELQNFFDIFYDVNLHIYKSTQS